MIALLLLRCLVAVTAASTTVRVRRLEDQQGNNNANRYGSGQVVRAGPCFRMKIAEDNDDDGNSYFYNGAYRSQYQRYMAFFVCQSSYDEGDSNCQEYVADLDTYLEMTVETTQNVCQACRNQCRRRMEEEGQGQEQGNVVVNCQTCASECELLMYGGGGNDESQYLQCQESYNDGELQYYTAPQCDNNGGLSIGYFYDDECTIKANSAPQDLGLEYNTFQTIERIGLDCSNAGDLCDQLTDGASYCQAGYYNEEQEDRALCKAAATAEMEHTYYKKPFWKKMHIPGILLLLALLCALFSFLSYTYYVRHTRREGMEESKKTPLAPEPETGVPELPKIT